MRYLERITNVAIIVAVVVFLAVVARNQLFPRKVVRPTLKTVPIGSTITLPGIHFSAQRNSLILGISTTCHFCQDSLPFYKRLVSELHGQMDIIAVLPQSQAEAEAFVKAGGLTGTQVISANLGKIGIYATPTLLLVDNKGKVKSAWVGELDSLRQQQIISALLPGGSSAVPQG
ncbi:MAG TPA: hypothetical protein VFT88_01470 [Acidobacteriaceae bacterium]|jgi:hypothetical protein|nr:hypothetical protein [Acidobacteriaceae bacterium]